MKCLKLCMYICVITSALVLRIKRGERNIVLHILNAYSSLQIEYILQVFFYESNSLQCMHLYESNIFVFKIKSKSKDFTHMQHARNL